MPKPVEPAPVPSDRVRLTLDRREEIAEGTWAFHFGHAGTPFPFVPGQAIDLEFPAAPTPDPRGHVRAFSLASMPGAPRLVIATRIRDSPFKRDLLAAAPGTELFASPAWGDFVVPPDEEDVVLLAGGIGVTPFRSILQDAVARSARTDWSLVHAGRTPEETPFLDEFRRWDATNPQFAYLPTMTQARRSKRDWRGETRRIDAAFLRDVLDDGIARALYLVAGPPGFVEGVSGALADIGVPTERILRDAFDGY